MVTEPQVVGGSGVGAVCAGQRAFGSGREEEQRGGGTRWKDGT